MTAYILDASAALEVCFQRPYAKRLQGVIREADLIISPSLFYAVTTNTLTLYHRKEALSLVICNRILTEATDLVDLFIPESKLGEPLFSVATGLRIAANDACYVILAQQYQCALLTKDKKWEGHGSGNGNSSKVGNLILHDPLTSHSLFTYISFVVF